MAFPNDLLEQALHLANREPKRPKQASLRRAVSTAYYALFHLLSIETAKNWRRPAERPTVARMLEHMPMSKVCATKRNELNEYFKTRPQQGMYSTSGSTFVSSQIPSLICSNSATLLATI
jgi:uncharacterized protein (UPF0332 family)